MGIINRHNSMDINSVKGRVDKVDKVIEEELSPEELKLANESVEKTSQSEREEKARKEKIDKLLKRSFLGKYLSQDTVTDISFNGTDLYIQDNVKGRYKVSKLEGIREIDIFELAYKVAGVVGKNFTVTDPILDTELDYLRLNFVHKDVSPFGTTMAIRVSKPRLAVKSIADLADKDVERLLKLLMVSDTNLIISGRTGSGKTEVQKKIVGFIPDNKKITLMEDTMDSHLKRLYPEKDINSWRTRTQKERKETKVHFSDLIKSGLRNNPDWLIISETRGSEANDMLNAALTDHSVITTIHASGAPMIPSRLISMIGEAKDNFNEILLGNNITSVLKFGMHMTYEERGGQVSRFIRELVEYTGYDTDGVKYNYIYRVRNEYKFFDEPKIINGKEVDGQYVTILEKNPISIEMFDRLEYLKIAQLVPDRFNPHYYKEVNGELEYQGRDIRKDKN